MRTVELFSRLIILLFSDTNFYLAKNGTCVPQSGNATPSIEPIECKSSDTYKTPSGYRRIPGNTCINGIPLAQPVEMPCRKSLKQGIHYHVSVLFTHVYRFLFFPLFDSYYASLFASTKNTFYRCHFLFVFDLFYYGHIYLGRDVLCKTS
jgi:hypothetical protein